MPGRRTTVDGTLILVATLATPADAQLVPDRAAATAGPVTLHDNGDTDGSNGYSNMTEGFVGFRRTLLDDFEVPAGELWRISALRHLHAVRGNPQRGMELLLWTDADGMPGAPDRVLDVVAFTDRPTGRMFFNRPEYQAWTEFEPVTLCPGRYWFEGAIMPADSDFWLITGEGNVTGTECWVNYDDLGGLQPGSALFEVMTDLAWALLGEVETSTAALPEVFDVFGTVVAGDLPALFESDDEHLVIANRPPPSVLDPAIELEVAGTAPCGRASALRFRVEASCTAVPPVVPQHVELYDFAAGGWVRMDTRFATLVDTVIDVAVAEEADRFVDEETRTVRARVRWLNPGNVHLVGWSARVDQTIWELTP